MRKCRRATLKEETWKDTPLMMCWQVMTSSPCLMHKNIPSYRQLSAKSPCFDWHISKRINPLKTCFTLSHYRQSTPFWLASPESCNTTRNVNACTLWSWKISPNSLGWSFNIPYLFLIMNDSLASSWDTVASVQTNSAPTPCSCVWQSTQSHADYVPLFCVSFSLPVWL